MSDAATILFLSVACGAMCAAIIPVFAVILAFPGKWVGKTLGLIVALTLLAWAGGSVGLWFLFQACSGGRCR